MFSPSSSSSEPGQTHQQGPFAGPGGTRDRQLFIAVKPVCVQILANCRPGTTTDPKIASQLAQLGEILARAIPATQLPPPLASPIVQVDSTSPPLSPSLLHYIFFPISQLFQATPKGPADLPDSTRREAFACLHLLVEHWWRQWLTIDTATSTPDQSQIWRQLLILAAVALTPSPDAKRSDSPETSLAILRLLHALLVPRQEELTIKPSSTTAARKDWEWDGESDLPSLDELDHHLADVNLNTSAPSNATHRTRLIYPTTGHQKLCKEKQYKSPLLHALTACLDLVTQTDSQSSLDELKATSLQIVRVISAYWIAPPTTENRAAAMAPVLPGITSKVVRLLTSTGKDSQVQSPTRLRGPLVARAVTLLSDVLSIVLDDDATKSLRQAQSSAPQQQSMPARTLEQLIADVDGDQPPVSAASQQSAQPSPQASSSKPTPADAFTITLKNITLAMQTLASDSSGAQGIASHSHPLVQQAIISFASALLLDCSSTLAWFESASSNASVDAGPSSKSPSSFAHLSTLLLRWLLDFDSDNMVDRPTSTVKAANSALRAVFSRDALAGSHHLCSCLGTEVAKCMEQIPHCIASQRGSQAAQLSHRVGAALRVMTWLMSTKDTDAVLRDLVARFVHRKHVERWGTRLVGSMQATSILDGSHSAQSSDTADPAANFAPLHVAQLDATEARALSDMLRDCGQLCGSHALAQIQASLSSKSNQADPRESMSAISYFLETSRRLRRLARLRNAPAAALDLLRQSTASLYIARELTVGSSRVLQDTRLAVEPGKKGKRARRLAHRQAEELIANVMDSWEEEAALLSAQRAPGQASKQSEAQAQASSALLASEDAQKGEVTYTKGLPSLAKSEEVTARPQRFGPALNLSFVDSAVVRNGEQGSSKSLSPQAIASLAEEQMATLRSLQLSLLALSSLLLGPSFRSHLLTTLYPTISALAASKASTAQAASRALTVIAHSSGYADLVTCVRENVDYILGEASWRLVSRLGRELEMRVSSDMPQVSSSELLSSVSPPMVLTQVMRLLGPESLHLIEDSIDEVLDALDRFHGYADVCESLIAVFDRLLEVMREGHNSEARDASHAAAGSDAMGANAARGIYSQLDEFDDWLMNRNSGKIADDIESAFDKVEQNGNEEGADEQDATSSNPTPATRSQGLVSSILSKCLPFLSHSNPLIRSRVLQIIGAGTELLCPVRTTATWQRREDDLLPLLNRAWPLIVAKMGWDMNRPVPVMSTKRKSGLSTSSESVEYVRLAAIRLCGVFARHVPDFMGRRIVQDAWPRMRASMVIAVEETTSETTVKGRDRQSPGKTRLLRGGSGTEGVTEVTTSDRPSLLLNMALSNPHSPLSQLLGKTMEALTPLISHQGPSFPTPALWEILSDAVVLEALCIPNERNAPLSTACVEMFKASGACDGLGTAWSVVRISMNQTKRWGGMKKEWSQPVSSVVGKIFT